MPGRAAAACTALAALLCLAVLAEPLPGIRALSRAGPAGEIMRVSAAISLLLMAIAVALQLERRPSRRARIATRVLAAAVLVISLLSLIAFAGGPAWSLESLAGIARASGRTMAPLSAVLLILFSIAMLIFDWLPSGRWPAGAILTTIAAAVIVPGFGYIFRVPSYYETPAGVVPLMGAVVAFLLLSTAALLARPERGWMALLVSPHLGGTVARRAVPVALLAPPLSGGLVVILYRLELASPEMATSIATFLALATLASFALAVASVVDRQDQEREREKRALAASESRLSEAQRIAHVGSWMWDIETNEITWTDEVYRLFGRPVGSEVTYPIFLSQIPEEDRGRVERAIIDAVENGAPYSIEHTILAGDSGRVVHERGEVVRTAGGQAIRMNGTVLDITERKAAEARQAALNRLLRAISEANQLLIRERNERSLLESFCRLIVEEAGFRMAWIGVADYEAGIVKPVAIAGHDDGYVESLDVRLDDSPRGSGPAARAIKERRPQIVDDFSTDERTRPWRDAARLRGFASSAVFPLFHQDQPWGALNVYAPETGAFRGEAATLLEDLAANLARTIEAVNADKARAEAVERLRLANDYNRILVETSLDPLLTISGEGIIIDANAATEAVTGRSRNEIIGSDFAALFADPADAREAVRRAMTDGWTRDVPLSLRHLSGSRISVLFSETLHRDDSGAVVGLFAALHNVTARTLYEEAIRASEEKFRYVFDHSPIGKSLTEMSGKLRVNRAFCEMLGYTAEELEALRWDEITHPDDVEESRAAIRPILERKRENARFTKRYLHKDGSVVWADVSTTLRRDEHGVPLHFITSITDVTQRKKADEALRAGEARYRSLVEGMRDGFVRTDMEGHLLEFNAAYRDLIGYADEEIRDLTYMQITPSQWHEREAAIVRDQIVPRGYSDVYEKEYRKKDGTIVPIELRVLLLRDGSGAPAGMWGIVRDISERRKAEEALRQSEARSRAIFDQVPVSIWVEDWRALVEKVAQLRAAGITGFRRHFEEHPELVAELLSRVVILDVNPETLRMFEAESKSDLLRSLGVVFSTPDTLPGFIDELVALAEGSPELRTEMQLRTVRGNLLSSQLSMTFPRSAEETVLVSLMDVTERVRATKELAQKTADLERSNRDLEQFAYVASHDLQEPLRMVSSFTQLLGQRYGDKLDPDAKDFIAFAVDGANRMQRLIGDLLAYSRVGTRGSPLVPADSHEALGVAIADLQILIEETGALVTSDDLPLVLADAAQLAQLFQNLIANAIKFRQAGIPPRIHVSASLRNGDWIFSVRDNGIGIAPEFHSRIFVIFQRLHTRDDYPGSGIGLAICKRIVERHGGRIWLESEPGRGSNFSFSLHPAGAAAPAPREAIHV